MFDIVICVFVGVLIGVLIVIGGGGGVVVVVVVIIIVVVVVGVVVSASRCYNQQDTKHEKMIRNQLKNTLKESDAASK